jgi:hypothetical protein
MAEKKQTAAKRAKKWIGLHPAHIGAVVHALEACPSI